MTHAVRPRDITLILPYRAAIQNTVPLLVDAGLQVVALSTVDTAQSQENKIVVLDLVCYKRTGPGCLMPTTPGRCAL